MNNSTEDSSNLGATDLETLDYLRGVKSSTCLLLPTTPSPTPLDFKHPLSEEMNELTFSTLNDDQNMVNIQTDASAGDSSSSADSNSVVQDPVSAQLINNISMLDYQTLSKNGDLLMGQTEDCKVNGTLNVNNRKLPSFVNWNWRIIRQVMLWIVLSGLIACLGAIITMVVTIPKECDPDLPWYQGKVFYEIFPASFKDSNNDGTGDLKGIYKKLDYIEALGASAIRLNYIFQAQSYPDLYSNITDLMQIDRSIGVLKDFQDLVAELHNRNMSLILDIPVISTVLQNSASNIVSNAILLVNDSSVNFDPTTAAIAYWGRAQNVDGFYLKNLEKFVDDPHFGFTLQFWRTVIGPGKILIASEKAYTSAKGNSLNVLLSRIDLIDVHLDLHDGVNSLKDRLNKVLDSSLWEKPHYPWVHWNIGNIDSERISTKHANNTLALTALELILPGTISIFYGDEIGLGGLLKKDAEDDFHEHKYVHNVVAMNFSENVNSVNKGNILPWIKESSLAPKYDFLDVIKNITNLRMNTPTIYMRSTYKDGKMINNVKICQTEENLVVFDRWFRRRNTYVFVGNLGNEFITTDLSTLFYGGTVVAATNVSLVGQMLYFDRITFLPNSAIVLKLEK